MDIKTEISLIGPGFRRFASDNIHMGYWTPELARWTDADGFEQKTVLQTYYYDSGIKYTGAKVNACPVVCIIESEIAERDLTVSLTGNTGLPSGYVISGDQIITGFSVNHQYGTDIYRRDWVTGGDEYTYEFTIPAHTLPGKTFLIPNKRIYEITDVNITPQRQDQPLTHIGLYALADNGSKLIYTLNWNKINNYMREILYSRFAAPKRCPTCQGSGYVSEITDACQQCEGYGYSGWNATGYMFDQMAREVGVVQESGESFETYQDKVWAKKWHVVPTVSQIKEYMAHFARCTTGEVEITNNFRTTNTSGVESVVDIKLPYILPESRFSVDDPFWTTMAESCEPAGINIRFSFLVSGNLTGDFNFEQVESAYMPYYVNGIHYTGGEANENLPDPHVYGFGRAFDILPVMGNSSWYTRWMSPWWFFNLISGQYTDGISGYAIISGATFSWSSGLLTGTTWMKWAQPAQTLTNDTIWETGEAPFVEQAKLWSSGTYYWDNFWGSGADGNIYY